MTDRGAFIDEATSTWDIMFGCKAIIIIKIIKLALNYKDNQRAQPRGIVDYDMSADKKNGTVGKNAQVNFFL